MNIKPGAAGLKLYRQHHSNTAPEPVWLCKALETGYDNGYMEATFRASDAVIHLTVLGVIAFGWKKGL
jgi:hypothetical protein